MFWPYLKELSTGPEPLLRRKDKKETSGGEPRTAVTFQLTTRGRQVMEGKADWTALHPVNLWLGGVHLTPQGDQWRWDNEGQKLVR